MKKLFIRLLPGSLAGNTIRLFTGTLFIQIISFLTLPVFSRIYTPSDYGIWSVFILISGFLSVISCLRYELAMMIPVSNMEADVLLRAAKTINLLISGLAGFIIVLFAGYLAGLFDFPPEWTFILLIPVHAYLTSYNKLMVQWISRHKMFSYLVRMRIIQGLINIGFSFVLGYFLNWKYYGLIVATFLSVLITDIFFSYKLNHTFYSGFIFSFRHIKYYIMRYRSFALYSTPFAALNYGTAGILTYVLQTGFGSYVTGLYANAVRIMHTPLSLLSTSFNPVFYQQFSRSESKGKLLLLSFTAVLLIFTAILFPLIIWGEELIVYYLGSQWIESAEFIKALALVTILSFSVGSVSTVFPFMQKENIVLIWQIVFFIAVLVIFRFAENYMQAIWLYSITGGAAYVLLFIIAYYLVVKYKPALNN